MPDHLNDPCLWLVGAGPMAEAYLRVLSVQGVPVEVIGRGETSAARLQLKTGQKVHAGGIERFAAERPAPTAAIVATTIDTLAASTRTLLDAGVRKILVEKPAGVDEDEIAALAARVRGKDATVFVAYNRRFYASVRRARGMIAEDGGVSSFHFEFTEWSHEIETLPFSERVKHNWLLANSSHVIDLAFFLGGAPRTLSAYVAGELAWHPRAAIFAGSGVSSSGAPFSYHANWAAPGRWGVEVLTAKRRLIFRPLEKLQVQPLKAVSISEEKIDDQLDREYKPGLYRQVEAFLSTGASELLSLEEHARALPHYRRMLG